MGPATCLSHSTHVRLWTQLYRHPSLLQRLSPTCHVTSLVSRDTSPTSSLQHKPYHGTQSNLAYSSSISPSYINPWHMVQCRCYTSCLRLRELRDECLPPPAIFISVAHGSSRTKRRVSDSLEQRLLIRQVKVITSSA